jgi:hypothetical protein
VPFPEGQGPQTPARINSERSRAPGFCELRRGTACRLSPRPFARYRRSSFAALRTFFLDEAEHFLHNRDASVATLRWCSGSSRNAVRFPFEISVRLRRNPHLQRVSFASLDRRPMNMASFTLQGLVQNWAWRTRPSSACSLTLFGGSGRCDLSLSPCSNRPMCSCMRLAERQEAYAS